MGHLYKDKDKIIYVRHSRTLKYSIYAVYLGEKLLKHWWEEINAAQLPLESIKICDKCKSDGDLNEDFVCATSCHHEDTSEKLLWEILALTRIQTHKKKIMQFCKVAFHRRWLHLVTGSKSAPNHPAAQKWQCLIETVFTNVIYVHICQHMKDSLSVICHCTDDPSHHIGWGICV